LPQLVFEHLHLPGRGGCAQGGGDHVVVIEAQVFLLQEIHLPPNDEAACNQYR